MSEVRSILEHQLAELVAEWSEARERKRLANQEFNEEIKGLEERIDGVLAEIRTETAVEASGQQRLPFERPEKSPTILPAEETPAADAPPASIGTAADANAEYVEDPCGPEEDEPEAPTQEEREEMFAADEDPDDGEPRCATCQHTEMVHGDDRTGRAAGCMAIGCACRRFVVPDPLGVNDHNPRAEKGVEPCDSAS